MIVAHFLGVGLGRSGIGGSFSWLLDLCARLLLRLGDWRPALGADMMCGVNEVMVLNGIVCCETCQGTETCSKISIGELGM